MEAQLEVLASLSLLPVSIGMLTDSRSFLSFPRHEYYRRILCNKIGQWVEEGEYPCKMDYLGKVVQNICYNNALQYLKGTDA
ncbi:MAG: glucuronate isomerase, partial [Eisenbergiella sp.]